MAKEKPISVCDNCGILFYGKRKFCTDRCAKLLECKAKGNTKFLKTSLAQRFQKMIRAEYAATPAGYVRVIGKDGQMTQVHRELGLCVCVTCGTKDAWNSGRINTGHFLASRRASILLEEDNVAPQCVHCNKHRSGAASEYRSWMLAVRGISAIERLERLKTQSVSFDRDELVDRWFQFTMRLKQAEKRMKG